MGVKTDGASKKTISNYKKLNRDKFKRALIRELKDEGKLIVSAIVDQALKGQLLEERSGRLAKAIKSIVRTSGQNIILEIGVFRGKALKYVSTQEIGATIKPRNAKALAIPLPGPGGPLTGRGVKKVESPLSFNKDMTFVPFRSSSKIIGGLFDTEDLKKKKTGGDLLLKDARAYYLLATEVTIPGKFFILKAFQKRLKNIEEAIDQVIIDFFAKK